MAKKRKVPTGTPHIDLTLVTGRIPDDLSVNIRRRSTSQNIWKRTFERRKYHLHSVLQEANAGTVTEAAALGEDKYI
jgi:hypothetical protein